MARTYHPWRPDPRGRHMTTPYHRLDMYLRAVWESLGAPFNLPTCEHICSTITLLFDGSETTRWGCQCLFSNEKCEWAGSWVLLLARGHFRPLAEPLIYWKLCGFHTYLYQQSLRQDLVAREARIKERKDMLQCRCQWFDGDMFDHNIFCIFIWYKRLNIFLCTWSGSGCMCVCVCSSARDVTKHGGWSPSPTGVDWVSDGVGIDSTEYMHCKVVCFSASIEQVTVVGFWGRNRMIPVGTELLLLSNRLARLPMRQNYSGLRF